MPRRRWPSSARVDKLRIGVPLDGTVALIVAEPSEAIAPGQPVMFFDPLMSNVR